MESKCGLCDYGAEPLSFCMENFLHHQLKEGIFTMIFISNYHKFSGCCYTGGQPNLWVRDVKGMQ